MKSGRVIPWYKSRGMVLSYIEFCAGVVTGLNDLFSTGDVSWTAIGLVVTGALQAIFRKNATGIVGSFFGGKGAQGGGDDDDLGARTERMAAKAGRHR